MTVSDGPLLRAIDHLTQCVECAALGYGGELKEMLDAPNAAIDERRDGYDDEVLRASLPALVEARRYYRKKDHHAGASTLVRVLRRWWQDFHARGRDAPAS